jgi:hypothetical protein
MSLLFTESPGFSQFKNSTIRDLNRIYQITKDSVNFSSNYESLINGIIKGLNTQLSHYKDVSYDAIRADIYEGVRQNFENTSTSNELKTSLSNNIKPSSSYTFKEIPPIPEHEFEFDDDVFVNMLEHAPPISSDDDWGKIDKKEFGKYQRQAVESIKDFLKQVDAFEGSLCKYREKALELMKNNLKYLIAVHYNYAYEIKNKLTNLKDEKFININSKNIKLVPSQQTFLKEAVKAIFW